MISKFPYQLYLVISEKDCTKNNFLKVAEQAIIGGVDIIQLREKNCSTDKYIEKAKYLKEITDKYSIPLIINDNVEVATTLDTAGVHVGNNDRPPHEIRKNWNNLEKYIGYSIEYLQQFENNEIQFADYLGISPVFSTSTKLDTVTEWGLNGIETIRKLTNKPLVAIGNVNKNNARTIINAGADCIAVVSAICGANNPEKEAYELKNLLLK